MQKDIFTSDDYPEALLRWSDNLTALGRILCWLNESDDPGMVLTEVASQIGVIVEDYANNINNVCNQAYGVLHEYFDGGNHLLLSRAKRAYKGFQENAHPCPANIMGINRIIEEIRPVLTEATTLADILRGLEKTKKTMEQKLNVGSQQNSAPAATAAAAGA
ncbi:MAG: hypothetical protein NTY16_06690 [Deltaproteobacteria bacterium]|nr:hypothetical protein [Deltaproteobacteria bacterium]